MFATLHSSILRRRAPGLFRQLAILGMFLGIFGLHTHLASAAEPPAKPKSAGVFDTAPVEKISLQQAIDMALQNNLAVKVERTNIKLEQSKIRFEAGVFDPTFSINISRESTRRPENSNDFTSSDQARQEANIVAIRTNTAAITANTNAIRAAQGLPPLVPAPTDPSSIDTGIGSGIGGSTSGIGGVTTVNGNLTGSTSSVTGTTTNTAGTGTSGVSNNGSNRINSIIFDQNVERSSSSLVQRTPWGMRFGFFLETNRFRNTFSGDTRDIIPEYQTTTSVQVVQPLLKDFGPAAGLSNIRLARINKHAAVLAWKQRLMSDLQLVMGTYYDMEFGMADIAVRQDAIQADENLVAQTQRRLEVGFLQPFDVQQARAQVSVDQEQLITAKNGLMERQFALKRLILAQFNVNDTRIFLPTETNALNPPPIDRSFFLQQAFANRPDFQQALAEADAQDIRLRFARNQLLPQLDLVATYGLNGLTDGFANSFDQGFKGHTPAWTVGINFRMPLGNIQARAQLDSVKAQKEQAILKIKQSELSIGIDVDTVISRIETNKQRLDTARKTRELYQEAVRIAYRRLSEGQISTFDIIEQQRRLYDAKSREVGARTELSKSVTQLWLVTGTVLEKMGIKAQE